MRTAVGRVAIFSFTGKRSLKYCLPFFCRIDGKILQVKIKMMILFRSIHIANMNFEWCCIEGIIEKSSTKKHFQEMY